MTLRQRHFVVRGQDGQTHGAAGAGDGGRRRAPVAATTVMGALRPAMVAAVLLLAVLVNSVVAPRAPRSAQAAAAQVGSSLSAWGWNGAGQLGNGTTTDSNTPVQVSGLSGVTVMAVAAGAGHNLALAR
jgi:Regulator of chromosome condensation (RCC1) repeat